MAAYPIICAEKKRVRLLHHIYDSSKLNNEGNVDGTPGMDCLEYQNQDSLNALLVQATQTENRCKQRKCVDDYNYSALSGSARVEVIRILVGAGADLSAIWKPNINLHKTNSPFCAMFDRTPGFLDDIGFFIEKGALQNIPLCDLQSCILLAVRRLNVPVLDLLVANGVEIPRRKPVHREGQGGHNHDIRWKILRILVGVTYRNHAEKVGLIVDLNLFDANEILGIHSASILFRTSNWLFENTRFAIGQIPILSFLTSGVRPELDVIQFLCAKGCLAPPPKAFMLAIQRRNFDFLFLIPYVFFNRGIVVEFPELKMEDIEYRDKHGEIVPRPILDFMKTQAALLAEMIRRSTESCPASFLDMMTFISTGVIPELRDRSVPRLQDLCILTVRTKVLIPDMEERFAEDWVVWNKVPAYPNFILPTGCLVPPMIESKIHLGDLVEKFWTA